MKSKVELRLEKFSDSIKTACLRDINAYMNNYKYENIIWFLISAYDNTGTIIYYSIIVELKIQNTIEIKFVKGQKEKHFYLGGMEK